MEKALINSRWSSKYSKNYTGNSNLDEWTNFENSGLLKVEENALLIINLLNIETFERTRDLIQINYQIEEDKEITIFVTAEEVEFRLETTEWTMGSYAPVNTSKLWKRLKIKRLSDERIKEKVLESVQAAMNKMEEDMVICPYCHKKFAVEHTIDGDVCHNCAVVHLNVIF